MEKQRKGKKKKTSLVVTLPSTAATLLLMLMLLVPDPQGLHIVQELLERDLRDVVVVVVVDVAPFHSLVAAASLLQDNTHTAHLFADKRSCLPRG